MKIVHSAEKPPGSVNPSYTSVAPTTSRKNKFYVGVCRAKNDVMNEATMIFRRTYSSSRLPIASKRSLGTSCRGIDGGGIGAVGEEVMVHIITKASCCHTLFDL